MTEGGLASSLDFISVHSLYRLWVRCDAVIFSLP
jgi:hypothetical protein